MDAKIEQLMRMTRRPSTPGDVLADLLECNNLTQGEIAERLGVSRITINQLIRGRRNLTPDMAHRLGRFFGDGPGIWLRLQEQVEMWDALHMDTRSYQRIAPLRESQKLVA